MFSIWQRLLIQHLLRLNEDVLVVVTVHRSNNATVMLRLSLTASDVNTKLTLPTADLSHQLARLSFYHQGAGPGRHLTPHTMFSLCRIKTGINSECWKFLCFSPHPHSLNDVFIMINISKYYSAILSPLSPNQPANQQDARTTLSARLQGFI